MIYKLHDIIPQNINLSDGDLILHQISLDDIFLIWKFQGKNNFINESCRPVSNRKDQEEKEFYKSVLKNKNVFIFGIYHSDNVDKAIGQIALSDFNCRNRSSEIGYSLMSEYQKRGYMRRCISVLNSFIFTKTPMNKIYAQTGEFNKSSINLLKQLHFHCDGHLREHHELDGILYEDYLFSLTRNDWLKYAELRNFPFFNTL